MTLRKEGMNFRNYFLPEANYAKNMTKSLVF